MNPAALAAELVAKRRRSTNWHGPDPAAAALSAAQGQSFARANPGATAEPKERGVDEAVRMDPAALAAELTMAKQARDREEGDFAAAVPLASTASVRLELGAGVAQRQASAGEPAAAAPGLPAPEPTHEELLAAAQREREDEEDQFEELCESGGLLGALGFSSGSRASSKRSSVRSGKPRPAQRRASSALELTLPDASSAGTSDDTGVLEFTPGLLSELQGMRFGSGTTPGTTPDTTPDTSPAGGRRVQSMINIRGFTPTWEVCSARPIGGYAEPAGQCGDDIDVDADDTGDPAEFAAAMRELYC